jgi:hypothetical protein
MNCTVHASTGSTNDKSDEQGDAKRQQNQPANTAQGTGKVIKKGVSELHCACKHQQHQIRSQRIGCRKWQA